MASLMPTHAPIDMIHRAKVGKKKLLFNTPEDEALFFEKNYDKEVLIEPLKRRRTMSANRYLWVIYDLIAEHTGHTSEDIHEAMKLQYLKKRWITLKGRNVEVPGSTKLLDTYEFSIYLERVMAEAADLGIVIPTKEEAGYLPS